LINIKTIEEARTKGIRITPQRKTILEELQKAYTHPTAMQLFGLVKKRDKKISLATVYRTLEFLEKNKLIVKIQSVKEQAKYDGNLTSHCHLVCKKCGEVIDIFDNKQIRIQSKELEKTGFKIETDYLEIPGLCANCQ